MYKHFDLTSLFMEINLDYGRCMNKIIFDKYLADRNNYDDFIFPKSLKPQNLKFTKRKLFKKNKH